MVSSFSIYYSTSEPGLSTSLRIDISYSTIWMLSLQLALCLNISISSSSNIYSINFSWSSPSYSWLSKYFFSSCLNVGTPDPRASRFTGPAGVSFAAVVGFFSPDLAAGPPTRPTYGVGWFDRRVFVLILTALWLDLWLVSPGLWSLDAVPPIVFWELSITDPKKPFFAGVSLENC